MKLVIVLFGISLALGYEEEYQGFNNCGFGGWTCYSEKNKHEVTYACPPSRPNARVWVWTARLPTPTSIFTVRDCKHLEVHFDCTKGLRSNILTNFRVINVTHLEILPPLRPGVFLHDNDQLPQAPPVFYVSNVKKIQLYPGVFDKAGGGCRYKLHDLTTLTFENVHIDRITKDLFQNKLMEKFVLTNVVIDAMDSNAIDIGGNVTIVGTTFPFIPASGMTLRGESISFINNTFKKIQTNGVIIKSKEVIFSKNHVDEVNSHGLDVMGAKIEITGNLFNNLETGALQGITPGYSPVTYEIASKFIYNFSDNVIKNINPGSIHLNWEVYKKVCSDIIFKNNLLECSCINLGWLSVSNGLGPKISKIKEFYDIYLNNEDNSCYGHNHCPLNVIVARIQDVCNNKTNISTICSSIGSATEALTVTPSNDVTADTSQEATDERSFQTDSFDVTEKAIPVLSYAENQTSHLETAPPLWFIAIPIVIISVSIGIFIWWYKKKKQRQEIMTIYENGRGADADNLIVIIEHNNELYDKQ